MEPNRYTGSIESVIERVKSIFPEAYLHLIAIIQASILGYFIYVIGTHLQSLSFQSVIISVSTFSIIVLTWYEYMTGSSAFRWIPRMRDCFIPFSLGIAEFLLVHHIPLNVYLWYYSCALFSFIVYLAFFNMYHSAQRYPENTPIFEVLGRSPKVTEILCICTAIYCVFLGVISHVFASSSTVQYITASLSLIMVAAFIYRGVKSWNKIVGTALGNK